MNFKNKENEDSEEDEEEDEEDEEDLGSAGKRRKDSQVIDLSAGNKLRKKHRSKPKKQKKDREFTIDEEFFHSVIMPSIYSTIVAGIK